MKKNFLSILVLTAVLISIAVPAFAGWFNDLPMWPGQKRETYKVSDVQPIDLEGFCQDRLTKNGISAPYKGVERKGDSIICSFEEVRSISAGVTHSNDKTGVGYSTDKVVNTKNFTVNDLCEWKHKGIGAFAGDGGASCYDSYRK